MTLFWLPEVLRSAGLTVIETPGWQTRSRLPLGVVKGVLCHHTAGPLQSPTSGNLPSLPTLEHGRPDLCGPLCQLALGFDGTWYVVAGGRANHAGAGNWQGVRTGNSNFIGVEAENHGYIADKWPQVQLDSYAKGVAAILVHCNLDAIWAVGHKEYALPPGRKTDPTFDMHVFRGNVSTYMKQLNGVVK